MLVIVIVVLAVAPIALGVTAIVLVWNWLMRWEARCEMREDLAVGMVTLIPDIENYLREVSERENEGPADC